MALSLIFIQAARPNKPQALKCRPSITSLAFVAGLFVGKIISVGGDKVILLTIVLAEAVQFYALRQAFSQIRFRPNAQRVCQRPPK